MGLRACIAFELFVGASLVSGLAVGGVVAKNALDTEFQGEALAATSVVEAPVIPPVPEPEPPTELNVVVEQPKGRFLGRPDSELLDPLRDSPVAEVKFNKGGSSISLRIDFQNGARAAFKPRQTNWQSVPRREIVAFRLNRLLGLSSVPPAIGRQFTMQELIDVLHPSSTYFKPRLQAEMIEEGGFIKGELSWWIPVIERGTVHGYELDSTEGIVTWKRYLSIGNDIPDEDYGLTTQVSDMVLFDFIINNPDRWSGGNARVSEDHKILYFMDNTMSFGDDMDGHPKARTYLERCQKFSKKLVDTIRELDESDVREVLNKDLAPFEFYLRDIEIEALMSRRDLALEYIDSLIAEHGEAQVLAFP